jgi:hypothetical protein
MSNKRIDKKEKKSKVSSEAVSKEVGEPLPLK